MTTHHMQMRIDFKPDVAAVALAKMADLLDRSGIVLGIEQHLIETNGDAAAAAPDDAADQDEDLRLPEDKNPTTPVVGKLDVKCRKCKAAAGENCIRPNGSYYHNGFIHRVRWGDAFKINEAAVS